MTLHISRFVIVDAINKWLSTSGPFLIGGKVIDGREVTATDFEIVKGDCHVQVHFKSTPETPGQPTKE